ncbi:hypothetical protein [Deinococcus sp. QL22]|uniref:hypothetical protein n=1 Tax=Deinococcus sp. QL22 TaxID=2939437 RepID=UPI002016F1FC|nr:hypothetical protein [Deinococcus sp. QL22]UQN09545.1 hypothetical protein M1R55_25700 [Deinococcus sp. QL22]
MSTLFSARSPQLIRPVLALLTFGSLVPFAAAQVQTQSIVVNPTVLNLTLIDADTDRPVPGYDPIAPNATLDLSKLPPRLNVRANTAGKIGSVRFGLDNQSNFRTEGSGPYALCSNTGGDFAACAPNVFAPGTRQISATSYASSGASGAAGPSVRVTLNIVRAAAPALSVTSLTLINADTDRPVPGYDPIPAGARLKLSNLPPRLNVRANVSAGVGSVRFVRDGKTVLENEAPFALCVDGRDNSGTKGNFYACDGSVFSPGDHRLTATPFSKMFAGGTAGAALTWNFSVDR